MSRVRARNDSKKPADNRPPTDRKLPDPGANDPDDHSYYYDDAYGYENFDPKEEEPSADDNDG